MRQVNNLKSHWLALIVAIVMVLSGLGFKYYHNHTYAGQPYTETNLSKLTQKVLTIWSFIALVALIAMAPKQQ